MPKEVECLLCKHFDFDFFEIDMGVSELVECMKGHNNKVGWDPVECEDFEGYGGEKSHG